VTSARLLEHEETIADHGQSALRFRRGGLVLNYVPVLRQPSVFDPENVRDDHWARLTVAREAPVEDHVVAVGDREGVLVPKRRGKGSHALEEPFATRADMSAVLDLALRPHRGRSIVVVAVEECIEGLQRQLLVSLFERLFHFEPPCQRRSRRRRLYFGPVRSVQAPS